MINPSDMTDEELDAIGANQCGSKGGWFKVPDYAFGDACDHHDAAYWIGGGKGERKDADLDFLDAMLEAAKRQVWYYRIHLECASRRYYWAVRAFGAKHFKHGNPKTRADLDMAVTSYRKLRRDHNA